MNDLLLTYYGDDFTGSTDVMESLVVGGVPTVLFLDPPTAKQLIDFPDVRAIGVAGVSRSMSPVDMDRELPPKFEALKALGAPLFHYKICSTFDSSPTVGSIGYATEIGCQIFNPPVVPLIVGALALKRYVVFGNLFAGVNGVTYRIDRHPTMSKHPITPMHESDLRLHLGQQTDRKIGLIDILTLEQGDRAIDSELRKLMAQGCDIVLFDTSRDEHLTGLGRTIWHLAGKNPVFIVGSSGVEYALCDYWQTIGAIKKTPLLPSPGAVDQLLVISGSAAPTTNAQIEFALAHGFEGIRLNGPHLINPATADAEREATINKAMQILAEGKSLILYSARGPEDPAIHDTQKELERLGLDPKTIGGQLGTQQGIILRQLLEKTNLKRVCVAGGDTCGYASRQLDIYALEIVIPIAPGAPLCKARSHTVGFDGLQISLKGGQNGLANYFVSILQGHPL